MATQKNLIGDRLDVIASGAVLDGQTVLKAKNIGLNSEEYFNNNVMDIQIVVIK